MTFLEALAILGSREIERLAAEYDKLNEPWRFVARGRAGAISGPAELTCERSRVDVDIRYVH